MDQIPVVGGFAVVAIVIAFRLLAERAEIRDLRTDVQTLRDEIIGLKARESEYRSEKHRLDTELQKSLLRLGIIIGSAERAIAKCTCGAVDALRDVLSDPRANPLERATDPH